MVKYHAGPLHTLIFLVFKGTQAQKQREEQNILTEVHPGHFRATDNTGWGTCEHTSAGVFTVSRE